MRESRQTKTGHSTPAPDRLTGARSGATRIRVRYCECDPMGVAHHAAYVAWMEIARTDLLRSSGVTYAQLEHEGVFLVIVKLDVTYRRPIYYDDVIELTATWTGGSRVKIEHAYEFRVVERDASAGALDPSQVVAIAKTTLGCVDKAGKIRALPDWLAWES